MANWAGHPRPSPSPVALAEAEVLAASTVETATADDADDEDDDEDAFGGACIVFTQFVFDKVSITVKVGRQTRQT